MTISFISNCMCRNRSGQWRWIWIQLGPKWRRVYLHRKLRPLACTRSNYLQDWSTVEKSTCTLYFFSFLMLTLFIVALCNDRSVSMAAFPVVSSVPPISALKPKVRFARISHCNNPQLDIAGSVASSLFILSPCPSLLLFHLLNCIFAWNKLKEFGEIT